MRRSLSLVAPVGSGAQTGKHKFFDKLQQHTALDVFGALDRIGVAGLRTEDGAAIAREILAGNIFMRMAYSKSEHAFVLAMAGLPRYASVLRAFTDATVVMWWLDNGGKMHPRMFRRPVGEAIVCEVLSTEVPYTHTVQQCYTHLSDAPGYSESVSASLQVPFCGIEQFNLHPPGSAKAVMSDAKMGMLSIRRPELRLTAKGGIRLVSWFVDAEG